jgi:hypothetical protein
MAAKTVRALMIGWLCSAAFAADYGQLMTTKVRSALGGNAVRGYTFATYPLDNFGVATAYEGKPGASTQVCATWDCLGINDDAKVATLTDQQKLTLVVNGIQYASVGQGTGLTFTEDEKKSLSVNALLPKILQVLSISGDYAHSNDITTTLTIGPAVVRILRRQQMMDKLNSADGHPLEKKVWANGKGNLVLVYSDIVVSSMKIEIKTNPATKIDFDAKMTGALSGKVGQIIGSGSDLGFKVDNSTKGDYTLEISKPLIVAVYTKKQPGAGVLGDQKGWNDWKPFDLGSANKVLAQKVDLGSAH